MPDTLSMAKTKNRGKRKPKVAGSKEDLILIDERAGLIFESEKELSAHFDPALTALEEEYQAWRTPEDFSDADQIKLEDHLEESLDDPDEVWQSDDLFSENTLHTFITDRGGFHYVAVAYVSSEDGEPTFVLTHFPTRVPELVEKYRRGELVYDRRIEEVQKAVVEGDALGEGDALAMGLYIAMKKVRSPADLPEDKFQEYAALREETIENADEIWRKNDLEGNILVSFIKEFPDHETMKGLSYVAVTLEDPQSGVHALLFSFPTTDESLVDRYRQGEDLQAEEIVQENSH